MPLTSHTVPDQNTDQAGDFEHEAVAILAELRQSLSKILERLDPPIARAADLRRRLDLDWKLSWSVFNATTAQDPKSLATLLPGRRAMQRLLAAAASQLSVPSDAIDRAQRAFDRFEQVVARHAGNRQAFETMLGEIGQRCSAATTAETRQKRTAFRANSALWGRHMSAFWAAKIVHPSALSPQVLDSVLIRGIIGLRRTKRAVPLHTVTHHWRTVFAGDPDVPAQTLPLDPRESAPETVGLLRDFCSRPLPQFRCVADHGGYRRFELIGDLLGRAGEVTFFLGESRRGDSAAINSVDGAEIMLAKLVDVPIATCVLDLVMHESVWGSQLPEVGVYACPVDGATEFRDSDALPLAESAVCLGRGIQITGSPLLPRCDEVLDYAMQRMDWNPQEFRVFRCKIQYPVLYTRIRMACRQAGL